MVLQEQLQDREQTIEKLEATIATVDVEAPSKITKRDDEIMWLRELLSVRKSDLQDIVQALSGEQYDPERVRDAAIRLRANLQMEEQERERALNGGSALNLPNLAASVRDIASPRVAQAVGPLAAAWGNWRKGRAESVTGNNEGSGRSTPSRAMNNSPANSSFLSGLLTPPGRDVRGATPPLSLSSAPQPSAFGNTGQRFTSAQLAARSQRRSQPLSGTGSLGQSRDLGQNRELPRGLGREREREGVRGGREESRFVDRLIETRGSPQSSTRRSDVSRSTIRPLTPQRRSLALTPSLNSERALHRH